MRTKFVEVIDDFLDESYFDFIANDVMNDDGFPWYYSEDASYPDSVQYTVNGKMSNRQGFSNLIIENNLNFITCLQFILDINLTISYR